MSMKYLLTIIFIPWCMSLATTTASACSMLYLDAYGMKKKLCGNAEHKTRRDLWGGLINHISNDQSWSVLNNEPSYSERIDIVAGHKSVRAGDQNIMAIALIVDQYGNPIPDKEIIAFKAGLSENPIVAKSESIDGLSVWLMDKQEKSATGYISAQTRSLQSKRSDFHVVSADAKQIKIQTPKNVEIAPLSQIELTAFNILDKFGNAKEDGAFVRFQSTAPDGAKNFAQGLISNKRATAFPFNKNTQAYSEWTAHIDAAVSEPITINSQQQELLPRANVTVEQQAETGTMTVKAGPFRTLAGHRVIDGTPIRFFWHDIKNGRKVINETEGHMVDGWANAIMPMPDDQPRITVQAHVLGKRFAASIEASKKPGVNVTTVMMQPQFYAELRGSIS